MNELRTPAVEDGIRLSPAEVRQVERACDRFESEWQTGRPPRPEDYLNAVDEPARSALLRQLLQLDWDYRRRAGEHPDAGDYLPRFPGDETVIEDVRREMTESVASTRRATNGSDAERTTWASGADLSEAESEISDSGSARYELVREVGHGGIGVVFRGRDRHLGRDLAVKVLREVYRDKPEARRRFIAEARVGSQLQHPAIVPVYEQGRLDDGRPYFTMKLVEGHTLAALLRERTDPGQDLARFLGVFEQVCQAMAYAHARGVVHRDLKPANVMVGAFGEVQVMDWGFAKIVGSGQWAVGSEEEAGEIAPAAGGLLPADRSQSGVMMGTPAYMPPEQARGESGQIGPRTDVFALGAMLCEILTGRPPYAGDTGNDIWRQAADGDLGDAFARLDACGTDEALWDLAKSCLVADPDERPAGAGAVAEDLTTHLASAQERLRQAQLERAAAEARAQEAGAKAKVERRAWHLTLALAVALLCGGAVATWQAVVANTAKHDALAAAVAQTAAKETADAKEAETRAILDFLQWRILAAARPEGQDGGLGQDVTLRHALEAALPVVEKGFAKQPLTEARLRVTLGVSFGYLGETKIAADQFERARAIYTQRLGPDDRNTLVSMNYLANSYLALGRHVEALKLREQTLALQQAKLGPDHPETLVTITSLANSYHALGRHAESLELREQMLALTQAKLGPDHPATLQSMNNLANSYYNLGRHADALKLREQTMPLMQAKLGPDHPDTLKSMHNLAISYCALGRHAEALKLREQTLALRQAKLGPDHPDTLLSMNSLANSYNAMGRDGEALELQKQTLALQQAKLGAHHPDTLASMHNLANSYHALGRHAEALTLGEQTLALQQAKLGPDHPETLKSMNNLANSYYALGRHADALKLHEQTLTLRQAKLGPDHPDTLRSINSLALSYHGLGRHAEALKLRKQTLALQKAKVGPDHPDTVTSMWGVAASLFKLDRGAEAVPIIDDCVRRPAGLRVHPGLAGEVMELRLQYFEKAKDAAGCRATAEMWENLKRTDAASLYDAACFRAVTAAVIRATDKSPTALEQADAEADRATAWLKKAVAAGYKDAGHMDKDTDLDALRDRADFQQLLAKLKVGE
jgi:serine/threonine protein kinase